MKPQKTSSLPGNSYNRRQQRRFVEVQRTTTRPRSNFGIRIPLYFGWEIVLGANRIPDARDHIVGPFRTYRAFGFSIATLVVIAVGVGLFVTNQKLQAATYTWTQTVWSTLTGTTAVHPTNQSGWNQYSAKDATTSADTTVTLTPATSTFIETNDTQFNAGTLSSTMVSGSGSAAEVRLQQGALTPPVATTSYMKAGSASVNGQHYLAYDSGSSAVWGIRNSTSNIEKMPTDGSASTSYIPAAVTFTALAYVPSRGTLFATAGDGKIREISTADGTVANTITPVTNAIGDVVYDATNDFLYYVSTGGNVKKIRPDGTGEALCYNGNLTNYSRLLQLDPTNASLYVGFTGEYTDSVVKVTLPGCTGPTYTDYSASYIQGLAYDTSTSSLWSIDSNSKYSKLNGTTLVTIAEYYTISGYSIAYDSFQSVLWIGDHFVSPYRLYKVSPADGSIIGTYTNMPAGFNSLITSLYEPTSNTLWHLGGSGTNFAIRWNLTGYASSGTFTSQVLNTNGNLNFGAFSWAGTTPANTTLELRVRTSNSATMVGAPAFATCPALTSGNDLSGTTCVTGGHQYVQYEATFGSSDTAVSSTIADVTLAYTHFADGTLTSSSFDALDGTNVIGDLTFAQTTTGTVEAGTATDSFERAGPALGSSWTTRMGTPEISGSSDFAGTVAGENMAAYTAQLASGDQFAEATISAISSGNETWACVRVSNSGPVNGYCFETDGTFADIVEVVNGAWSGARASAAQFPGVGDTIRIEVQGTDLRGYINGTLVMQGTDNSSPISYGYPAVATWASGTPTSRIEQARGGSLVQGGGSIQFQLRTSADNANWSSWLGPTGTGDYYTDPAGSQAINSQHQDGINDRYVQYRAYLADAAQVASPVLTSVTVTYVVNAPPEFQAAPTAVQNSDGTVSIQYSVRSPDTSTDTGSIGLVTPSFEYSLDNGSHWSTITSGLPGSATTPKAVEAVNYTTHNTVWTAKTQLDGTYASQAMIRVTVSDLQAANATAQGDSIAFVLDVKNPALGGTPISVNASTVPAAISLSASDDTALQMCVTLDNTQTNCTAYNSNTTLTLGTDPDTVYVIFVDSKGNLASANAATPPTPSNLIIRDLSNVPTAEYQLFVTWAASSVAVEQFANYKVYHSSDGTNFSLLSTITDKTINYHFHKTLVSGTTHYYKVSTTTNAANTSYFSNTISGIANGQGGGNDVVPPLITNVQATSITTQSAIITWDTDELSQSTVGYSTSPSVFTTEVGVPTMVDSDAGVGHHSVTVNGLTPGTTYYYQVQSSDPSGNESTDSSGGDGYSFDTVSGPTITNVTTTTVDNTSATITWLTNIGADSTVRYSTSAVLSSPTTVTVSGSVTNHSVTLTGLTPGTKYYFEIASGVALDPNGGNYYNFTTTNDTVAPTISSISVAPITDTQAVIVWATNEKATGQIAYGTTSGVYPNLSSVVTALNVNHAITLSDLSPNTDYFFTITSADGGGYAATSVEQTFTTLDRLLTSDEAAALVASLTDATAPTLTAITVQDITASSANVTWTSNEDANSFVKFGPVGGEQVIYGNWVYGTTHSIPLLTLAANTAYTFNVVSADKHGNITTSASSTFTTIPLTAATLEQQLQGQVQNITESAQDLPGPTISGQPLVTLTPTSATITWTTDKPANSLIAYASAGEYAVRQLYTQTVGNPEQYVTSHSVKIGNLSADTDYHYQIKSTTEVFQASTTADAIFHTPKLSFAIDNYSIDTPSTTTAIFRWTTTDTASASVQVTPYRNNILAVDEQLSDIDNTKSFIHQISMDTLEPGVQYQVELISVNVTGNRTSRTIPTFSTSSTGQPPVVSQIRVDSALSPGEKVKVQTIVSWMTDIPSTSRVLYRSGVGRADEVLTESTTLDTNFTKHHVVVITTFEPGAVYQLRVESKDSNGQVSTSKALTTLTPQQQQTVFQVITNTFQQVFGWTRVFNQ